MAHHVHEGRIVAAAEHVGPAGVVRFAEPVTNNSISPGAPRSYITEHFVLHKHMRHCVYAATSSRAHCESLLETSQ